MSRPAMAFMSYVRLDDAHENGRLTQFRERLSGEVRLQTGEPFEIFQDRQDIAWGEAWQQRIHASLDAVTFLIPVITPAFFKSEPCRDELQRFLDRERQLGRQDLVLPLYYVESRTLSHEPSRAQDLLAQAIAARQLADWRELRFEPFTSPTVGRRLAEMAQQIVEALERVAASAAGPLPAPAAGPIPGTLRPANPSRAAATSSGDRPVPAAGRASDELRGPAAKTEPPTLVVDAMHRGDHASIGAALKAAKPGTRILVRPGLYREGLVVDKAVEIIGEGEPGETVVEARGQDVVLFQANMGRIANLTLRQRGDGKWFGVHIAQGRLELEDCDISSESLSCVAINGGADPRLRRNRIHESKESGVFVFENGEGTLEDNDIFANAFAGVSIATGGNPTLRRNRIHDGKQGGVRIYESGSGTLEDNDIFANASAGVEIRTDGNPILRRNRIHDGRSSGVFIHEGGTGTLEDNDVFANTLSGIEIRGDGNVALRRNSIHDGEQNGVLVHKGGQGTLEDNDIFANAFAGVEIRTGGNPVLRRNRIHGGKQNGVFVNEDGQGTLEDNDIFGHARSGVLVQEKGAPVVRGNRVTKNQGFGVTVLADGGGTFEDNDLSENADGPWSIAPGAEAQVKRAGNTGS